MYYNIVLVILVILLLAFFFKKSENLVNLGTAHPNILSNPAPNPFATDSELGLNWQNRFMHIK
jgi:hypothetical protein